MNFEHAFREMKQSLEALATAENVEQTASAVRALENLSTAHEETEHKLNEVQSTLLDWVKSTSFNTPSPDADPIASTQRSIDDVISENLQKIIDKRGL